MPDSFTIKVNGLQELDRKLRDFGPKIQRNGLRAANYAGAKVFLNAAKQTAPVRTGLLRANLVTFRRSGPANQAKHSVGVRNVRRKYAHSATNRRKGRAGKAYFVAGPAFYGKYLEYGTSKMRARPFLRPAFLANIEPAIEAVRARLEKAVLQAVSKFG